MRSPIYLKLAWQTLKRSYRITLPFLLGTVLMISMQYSITAMAGNPDVTDILGGQTMKMFLGMGSWITRIFSVIFLIYMNSVLIRNRRQEQGLFSVLGLNKGHLARIVFYQLLILLSASLLIGIPAGLLLDKGMYLLAGQVLGIKTGLGFYISKPAILETAVVTGIAFLILMLLSLWDIRKENPVELLKGKQQGEVEPRNRWILAVLGLISLGIGYWMAITIEDPVEAIMLFFVAVLFVMAGTYLLFMFGSITLIRILQKNKAYYYQPNHFISVSNMKYRMKQNAVSLANIAILSTTVLVALGSSIAMINGIDARVNSSYGTDAVLRVYAPHPDQISVIQEAVDKGLDESGLLQGQAESYAYSLMLAKMTDTGVEKSAGMEMTLLLVDQADYNRLTGSNLDLAPDQIYGYFPELKDQTEIDWFGHMSPLVQAPEDLKQFGDINLTITQFSSKETKVVVIRSWTDVQEATGEVYSPQLCFYFDLNQKNRERITQAVNADNMEKAEQVFQDLTHELTVPVEKEIAAYGLGNDEQNFAFDSYTFDYRESGRMTMKSLYGGLMFIGLYVAMMFGLAVVLIMYYKQITEGMEDQKRFKILQNVGLEQKQIKKVINDQVLILFFMPLLTAGLHTLVAYPMISRMLFAAAGADKMLTLIVFAICFAVFAVVYIIVYRLTARTYYSMVRQQQV